MIIIFILWLIDSVYYYYWLKREAAQGLAIDNFISIPRGGGGGGGVISYYYYYYYIIIILMKRLWLPDAHH